jgi:hypothetical protein
VIALGFGLVWVGYLELLYGYCLIKGYDITWRELADPIRPYQWPKPGAKIEQIPPTQILPGKPSTSTTSTAGQPPPVTANPYVPGGPGTA